MSIGPRWIAIDGARAFALIPLPYLYQSIQERNWIITQRTSILLVANRTAQTTALRDAVRRIAERRDVHFHLLVPRHPRGLHRVVDPEDSGHEEAEARLAAALPALSSAARRTVSGEVGDADPLAAIQDTLNRESFDEIIVSTLPARMSRWLHLDLPSKARGLGLPVTHVEAEAIPFEAPETHAA